MQVCVLGPLVVRDEAAAHPAGGRIQRRVLARLAMDAGSDVSLDDLEEAAWGDDSPHAARHTIATYVFRLRKLGLAIATHDDRYRLESPTDLIEMERLAAESRGALAARDQHRAVALLRESLALWRGQPLADLADLPDARITIARLEELADGLREDLLALELDLAPSAGSVSDARRLVDAQPYRERRWELLMLALYRNGRQADALDAYAGCRRTLRDDLGLDPGPRLRRMQQAVLAQDPALDPPASVPTESGDARRPTAEPVEDSPASARLKVPGTSTRLIGRSREQQELAEVWERARLATLLGPPGAGKTRLALEFARASAESVWYVGLEQVPDSQSVAAAILGTVDPSSRAADATRGAIDALASSAGWLVIDGCEARRGEVADQVARLLVACPDLRILATSRQRLGIRDEAVLPIGPLSSRDAIDLLVDRARLLDPGFRLRGNDPGIADHLCALVDRLPLGLELVARHLQLLSLDEVVERVEADLGRWAGAAAGDQPGLWAALDASLERLQPPERRTLVALAVMVADADLELVAAVAAFDDDGTDSFETVARLVDASLVQVRSANGPTRYALLRTLAERTLETAPEGDQEQARDRYADAVLARVTDLAGRLAGADRSEMLRRLDREMPHARAVLGRVIGPPVDTARVTAATRLAVQLTDYWLGRHPAEGMEWLGRLVEAGDPPPPLRAEALLARGHLCYWVTDFAAGAKSVDEAHALFASLRDPLGEGRALRRRGAIAAATDDLPAARGYLEASLERFDVCGAQREIGTTLLHLGSLLADEGFVDEALPALERAQAIAVANGDPLAQGHVLAALSLAYWKQGDLEAALDAGNHGLLIFRELGHRPTEGTVAYRLAAIVRGLGRPRAARRYAQLALEAGKASSTRTTVAHGHINLARLDLDSGDDRSAADQLMHALEQIDPVSDRWVLVEALEVIAGLLVAREQPGATRLLAAAAAIRRAIHQPSPPTEAADLQRTTQRALAQVVHLPDGDDATGEPGAETVLDADAAHAIARLSLQALFQAMPRTASSRRARH